MPKINYLDCEQKCCQFINYLFKVLKIYIEYSYEKGKKKNF